MITSFALVGSGTTPEGWHEYRLVLPSLIRGSVTNAYVSDAKHEEQDGIVYLTRRMHFTNLTEKDVEQIMYKLPANHKLLKPYCPPTQVKAVLDPLDPPIADGYQSFIVTFIYGGPPRSKRRYTKRT